MADKIPNTYCPLCGSIGLLRRRRGSTVIAYCSGPGVEDFNKAHTAYELVGEEEPQEPSTAVDPGSGDEDEEEEE